MRSNLSLAPFASVTALRATRSAPPKEEQLKLTQGIHSHCKVLPNESLRPFVVHSTVFTHTHHAHTHRYIYIENKMNLEGGGAGRRGHHHHGGGGGGAIGLNSKFSIVFLAVVIFILIKLFYI